MASTVGRVFGALSMMSVLAAACAPRDVGSLGSPSDAVSDTLWLLAPDAENDPVHATDREADLVARHGAANVVRDSIHLGEGEYVLGSVLFPRDPARRLEIVWEDTAAFVRPMQLIVTDSLSRWTVFPGVRMRTSLRELEALNRGAFRLVGFSVHYEGTVVDWQNGALDSLWRSAEGAGRRVVVRLTPDISNDAGSVELHGEGILSSSHPGMQAVNPRVYELMVVPR